MQTRTKQQCKWKLKQQQRQPYLIVDSLLTLSMWRDDTVPIPYYYKDIIIMLSLYELSYQVGLSSQVLYKPRCILMLQMLKEDSSEQKEICPNIYSNWQFWHLTMQPRTDSTNLMNLCIGCKQTTARKIMIVLLFDLLPSSWLVSTDKKLLDGIKWAKGSTFCRKSIEW